MMCKLTGPMLRRWFAYVDLERPGLTFRMFVLLLSDLYKAIYIVLLGRVSRPTLSKLHPHSMGGQGK